MIGGLWVAASGMVSRSAEINVWANDVANVNTPAFLAEVPSLADSAPGAAYPALLNPQAPAGALAAQQAPPAVLQGGGVAPGPVLVDTVQASVHLTGRPLDVAIQGPGWLRVGLPGGGVAYTREGRFAPDASGTLVDAQGNPLLDSASQPMRVPTDATAVSFAPDGRVLATVGGRQQVLGRVELSIPTDPQGMAPAQGGLWQATPAAGALARAYPGTAGAPLLLPGALLQSNVNLTVALTHILAAEQAYQANSRAFAVGLSMWTTANQIPG